MDELLTEKEILFLCQCGNPEHQMIMRYFDVDYDDDKSVYVSVFLRNESNFFKRLWLGIKYIFGYRSIYGYFDEFIFKGSDYPKLQTVVDYLKKDYES